MRRSEFAIKDKKQIEEILHSISYGTLALAKDDKPYSIPVNFAYEDGVIYFHGAKKGRKKEYMLHNSLASFSVVEPFSMIQSYFSSNDGLACPATHFFRSIICDGVVEVVDSYDTKVKALQLLMEKLQSEGGFKHLSEDVYEKMINATEVFRFEIKEMSGKVKLGQHLPKERYEMVLEHLQKRGSSLDQVTIQQMKEQR